MTIAILRPNLRRIYFAFLQAYFFVPSLSVCELQSPTTLNPSSNLKHTAHHPTFADGIILLPQMEQLLVEDFKLRNLKKRTDHPTKSIPFLGYQISCKRDEQPYCIILHKVRCVPYISNDAKTVGFLLKNLPSLFPLHNPWTT
jgi:hypothetical protein